MARQVGARHGEACGNGERARDGGGTRLPPTIRPRSKFAETQARLTRAGESPTPGGLANGVGNDRPRSAATVRGMPLPSAPARISRKQVMRVPFIWTSHGRWGPPGPGSDNPAPDPGPPTSWAADVLGRGQLPGREGKRRGRGKDLRMHRCNRAHGRGSGSGSGRASLRIARVRKRSHAVSVCVHGRFEPGPGCGLEGKSGVILREAGRQLVVVERHLAHRLILGLLQRVHRFGGRDLSLAGAEFREVGQQVRPTLQLRVHQLLDRGAGLAKQYPVRWPRDTQLAVWPRSHGGEQAVEGGVPGGGGLGHGVARRRHGAPRLVHIRHRSFAVAKLRHGGCEQEPGVHQ